MLTSGHCRACLYVPVAGERASGSNTGAWDRKTWVPMGMSQKEADELRDGLRAFGQRLDLKLIFGFYFRGNGLLGKH